MLLVGVGRATRLLRFLTSLRKEYTGEVVLGVETSTLDASGEVVAAYDMPGLGVPEVQAAADRLVGPIDQVPPMVSAVKVGGRRLHELAREGVEVERAARPVVVHRFDVTPGPDREPSVFTLRVECSSGTYVRVLAADLGRLLGGGAHLRNLRRVAVGSFRDDEALPLAEITRGAVLPPATALRDYVSVTVDAERAVAVGHGKVLPDDALGAHGDGPWAVLDGDGRLLGVYERHREGTLKPAVVLPPATDRA